MGVAPSRAMQSHPLVRPRVEELSPHLIHEQQSHCCGDKKCGEALELRRLALVRNVQRGTGVGSNLVCFASADHTVGQSSLSRTSRAT